ncbi:putative aspartate aminotransferase, cytoplasmic 2 isoform X2 [Ctenopharyngodon idella]|uniref:putative aspartate aminotransferase, cytoplasmic 2 isoform X2 n=1 Tax=Ctenopharyngodon idella TaxID=7959 RepID=UPI00222F2ADC|nr:putative aspartate aminotransferase, cytoplasmic 2 isoform X2 [Ctenopharyngodon idella]
MHQHEMSASSVFDGAVFMSSEMKLIEDFKRDTHPDKVNLAGREYVGEHGQTTWLPLVRKIKQQIATDPTINPEYPPILGIPEFTRRSTELALGKDSPAIVESRVFGVQTIGCTGAVRLGAELLRSWYCSSSSWSGPILLSSPCDDSLTGFFKAVGIEDVRHYRYWDAESNEVCVENMVHDLENAPERQEGVKAIAERCMLIRERLRERLRILGGPGRWDHIIKPGGLYCCFGLNAQQVEFLIQRKHIYLLPNGCLNVSAINSRNLDYVAESIHQAMNSQL